MTDIATIVLIEDNPADVLLVERALQKYQIACHLNKFVNGEDALNALCPPLGQPAEAVPDVILLDLNTPRCDGFDVLRRLRTNPQLVRAAIAILSSSGAKRDRHRSELLGAVRYIEKPSELQEFITSVGSAVLEMLPAARD